MKNRLRSLTGALKTYCLIAVGFALLVMMVGAFTAGPAIAQAVRAAVVKNVDERGRVPYVTFLRCSGNGSCGAGTVPVPDGKRLVLEHISANITYVGNAPLVDFNVSDTQLINGITNFTAVAFAHATFDGQFDGVSYYSINEPLLVYVEAGHGSFAGADLNKGAAPGLVFTTTVLTGYLVDLSL